MHRRRFNSSLLTLLISCKVIGSLFMGFVPMVHAAAAPEHAEHCNMMMHGAQGDATAPAPSDPTRSGHGKHGEDCHAGCQCGCIHAPAPPPPAVQSLDFVGCPPLAQAVADLNIQARPDSVFKPPI